MTNLTANGPNARSAAAADERVQQVSALFDAEWWAMVRLAVLMVGDQPSAEDVAAEAFTEVFRRWDKIRDPVRAIHYLRSTVLNRSRSMLRRRLVARRHVPHHVPPVWSAESEAVLSEQRRDVLRALLTLPSRRREVLILRFYLELSDAEIAETLGVSAGTVRSQASRGLAALGRILEESP